MLGIKPTVDFAFKKIFGSPGNEAALLGLLNAILQLENPIVRADILNPFNYQEFADAKLVVLDVRARDSTGRWLNIEMQVSVISGLLQRLVYYACTMYVEQLGEGEQYPALRPAISICLLPNILFADESASDIPHHRFRLADPEHKREISNGIEVHTVELSKYNLRDSTISRATAIEQWAFFLMHAQEYEAEALRELLPAVEFQEAISTIETIAAKTEDRLMYDQRQKAILDEQWKIDGAREEGIEKGTLLGKIQVLQEIVGDTPTDGDVLASRSANELATQLAELQGRVRSRDAE